MLRNKIGPVLNTRNGSFLKNFFFLLNPQGFKIPIGDNLSPLPPLSSKLLFFPVSCSFSVFLVVAVELAFEALRVLLQSSLAPCNALFKTRGSGTIIPPPITIIITTTFWGQSEEQSSRETPLYNVSLDCFRSPYPLLRTLKEGLEGNRGGRTRKLARLRGSGLNLPCHIPRRAIKCTSFPSICFSSPYVMHVVYLNHIVNAMTVNCTYALVAQDCLHCLQKRRASEIKVARRSYLGWG